MSTNADSVKGEGSAGVELAQRTCVPCRGGVPPLPADQSARLLEQLDGWALVDGHHLHKRYAFANFAEALAFANRVGAVAEAEGHHPDLVVAWGRVEISIWTHKIDGLTESDFILAAKCDVVPDTPAPS